MKKYISVTIYWESVTSVLSFEEQNNRESNMDMVMKNYYNKLHLAYYK